MAEKAKKDVSIEELREQFKSLTGKEASPKARAAYLQKKIDELLKEKPDAKTVSKGEQDKQEKGNKEKVVVPKVESKNTFSYQGVEEPLAKGNLFAVIVKGSLRYHTQGSIDLIHKDIQTNGPSSRYQPFEVPAGSPYVFKQKKRGA